MGKCQSGFTGSLNFGSYDPMSANLTSPLTAMGTISLQCTRGAGSPTPAISLNAGSNAGHVTVACPTANCTRALTDGAADYLAYDLYTDLGHTTVWGGATTQGYNSTTMGATNVNVYGDIPGGQDVPASTSYSDSVIATVNY